MYHPQCELLMPHDHEGLDMDAGQSHHLAAGSAVPAELNFHLLSYVDTAISPQQPTVEYFFGGTDQPQSQFEQLAANHQAMTVLRDYYGQYPPTADAYLPGGPRTGSSSLVFGAAEEESAYMVGGFQCSPKPRTGGGRKRSRGAGSSFHGFPANGGVEKKEKQRRQRLSEKFTALMLLIPNRTKEDRATVIFDAIEYIQELGRTVEELTLLVEKKRGRREHQGDVVDPAPLVMTGEGECSAGEVTAAVMPAMPAPPQPIRSTYIQRKSKETFVDVRIVEDEVNIKLTKRRRDGCLAAASRALDDLHLDLVHLSGGKIGDCHIYMFNTKIHPGSPVFASAVASKLIEVVDEY
ncbi:transcription factor TIP2-like [Hordeum vulgare subsp. vulgare]|nr:transcription factor TIP2-like [Hordeum vulgare subsp. vulgare]